MTIFMSIYNIIVLRIIIAPQAKCSKLTNYGTSHEKLNIMSESCDLSSSHVYAKSKQTGRVSARLPQNTAGKWIDVEQREGDVNLFRCVR